MTKQLTRSVRGIWSAVLTPITAGLTPDPSTAIPYYRDLLERGCDGINLLGTTGEAMSFSAGQRVEFMEAIASSGISRERVMAGTGAASLAEAVRLTRCAFECGFAAALVMPPFFFREVGDDGIVGFFDALLTRSDAGSGSILLYNFPRMSGIAFRADLVDRLLGEFPGIIAGMKDSSNDAQLQAEVLSRRPDLAVLAGSESDLLAAKARGVSGCISGSVALWPEHAQEVFATDDEVLGAMLSRARASLDGVPFIPAVRHLTATLRAEPVWERWMPPQASLTAEQRDSLNRAIRFPR